jgi:hypothetical protein
MAEGMPEVETDDLGRYLEDTITIDWQTPIMSTTAKGLLAEVSEPKDRLRKRFDFVRDEIDHSMDIEGIGILTGLFNSADK